MAMHSWSSQRITGVFRTRAAAPANVCERQDTQEPPAAAGGNGPIGELQLTFGHAFLEQPVHHRRPDEGSGAGGSHEHQDSQDPLQAIGGNDRSGSCS
ncbi:hypothetical protein [Paenibacillus tyrfis]|uniref:hypothetical protein n=1 Tax=Paenibacillus tyrfis TaxID=1501230 RepID=UPI000B593263|nr:hypothetical protein [Paenibacillus tyrfis]